MVRDNKRVCGKKQRDPNFIKKQKNKKTKESIGNGKLTLLVMVN